MSDLGGGGKPTAHNAAEGGAAPKSDDSGTQTYGLARNANEFRDLKSNGEKITAVASSTFVSIIIVQEINAPAMCQVVFELDTNWTDNDYKQFAPGSRLSIPDKVVQDEQLPPMYVSGLTLDGSTGSGMRSTLTVTAFDKMHFLRFGEYTTSFVQKTDTDIFNWLAKTVGLTLSPERMPQGQHPYPYVLQDNETCYDFLLRRCRQGHYQCMVKLAGETENLSIAPRLYASSAAVRLFYNYDIEAITLDMRVPTLGTTVSSRGYNISKGSPVMGTYSKNSALCKMKGDQTAFEAAKPFGPSPVTLRRPDLNDEVTLDFVARSDRERLQDTFIEGVATLRQLNFKASPGVTIALEGLNGSFDGLYYVVKSTHRVDRNRNFTILNLTRSGM